MAYTKCHCSHSKDCHEDAVLSCTLCECTLYRPDTTTDPFKNSVQQKTVRLLAMARESESPKTRKLGAKIEELLGELEEVSEQEIARKAELEKQRQEREAAEKALEKAREMLEQAEAAMSRFQPVVKPGRKRKTPVQKPENLVIVQCDITDCEWTGRKLSLGVHKYSAHGIRKES